MSEQPMTDIVDHRQEDRDWLVEQYQAECERSEKRLAEITQLRNTIQDMRTDLNHKTALAEHLQRRLEDMERNMKCGE